MSNSKKVLESVSVDERVKEAKKMDLATDKLPNDKVLGVHLEVSNDQLRFDVIHKAKPLTRRGILKIASSVNDPFDFIAPFTIRIRASTKKSLVNIKS